jgi:hypothetical protein
MSESAPRGSQVPSAAVPGLEHAVDHVTILMFRGAGSIPKRRTVWSPGV